MWIKVLMKILSDGSATSKKGRTEFLLIGYNRREYTGNPPVGHPQKKWINLMADCLIKKEVLVCLPTREDYT